MKPNRRRFLTSAAALALPYLVPRAAFGANDRVVTGHIGIGSMGRTNLNRFLSLAQPAAICDVDSRHAAQGLKLVTDAGGKADVYGDFRRILERSDIDAVVISTPDHWHALPAVRACEAEKDVYVEKPMTLTIDEGRAMVEAARRHDRIVQNGSQQRSAENFRTACELVRSGRLGRLVRVEAGLPGCQHPGDPGADGNPPPELDYDLWLGPAPWRTYNPNRVHRHFRHWWDYAGGQLTNWGAHHIDIAQWGMGTDDTGPVAIAGEALFHPKGWIEVPEWFDVTYEYASGVTLHAGQQYPLGTTFIGTEGKIYVNRGHLASEPEDLVKAPLESGAVRLYHSRDHWENFIECVRTRQLPICDVLIGHRSATVCHLGNIACRTGRKIRWDPDREHIIGDAEADARVRRPYRAPWVL